MPDKETPPYVPTAKEQDDITEAVAFKKESYQQTRLERQEWRTSYMRYKLARKLSEYDYIPDVQLGLTYDSVERITATLPGREFGFQAKPVGIEDTQNALLFSEVLSQAWNSPDIMDGPTKMDVIKKNMALFGSAFAQVYWDTVIDEKGNTVKSDPCFVPINIFDVYYNKFIAEIEDLPQIGYQSILSLSWFKQHGKEMGFKNVKYVKGYTPRSSNQDEDSGTVDQEETQSGSQVDPVLVRLFEVQTDKEILTIALDNAGPVWLRKIPNRIGRKNCVIFRLKRHPLPNRLLGVTDISKAGNIEDAIQRVGNQMIFNSLLVDNPNFTFDSTDRHIDPHTFVTAPGAGIPRGKDPNSLTPIVFPSHMADSLNLIAALQERYKRVVNTPDILAGEGNANTASQDNLNDTNAKAAVDKIVDGMKGSMQKLGILIRELYSVYGPESLTVQIRTPELANKLEPNQQMAENSVMEISKADLALERDIDITVDFTSQNKAVLSRRIVEWLNITAKDQSVPPQLRMQAYEKWLEFNDLDDLAAAYADIAKVGQTSDLSLADQENAKMAGGMELPPTPNASTAHTQRHIDFMRRTDTGPEIDRLLQTHIEGEIMQSSQNVQPQPEQPGQPMETQSENPVAQTAQIGQV